MVNTKLPTLLSCIVLAQLVVASASPAETWTIEVRETSGIQRFGYPLTATFQTAKKPDAAGGFLLRDGNRVVSAQFSLIEQATADKSATWEADFTLDLLPNESRSLSLETSKESPPEPRAGRGLKLERSDNQIHVRHPSLEFVVNDDLKGLFHAIRISGDDWLAGTSRGLVLDLKDGTQRQLTIAPGSNQNPTLQVVKSGSLAIALRFNHQETLPGGQSLRSTVQLDFPLGKSWAKVDWVVDDQSDLVKGVGAELRLRLDQDAKQPILGDFGANGWTYAVLRADEAIAFQAGMQHRSPAESEWRVDRTQAGKTTPYVLPSTGTTGPPVQGWAHLMDRKRCTAIAIDKFADHSHDTIQLAADGQIALRRQFGAAGSAKKQFTFWLHLVSFPPQLGAATSPQSMQMPPEVSVRPAKS